MIAEAGFENLIPQHSLYDLMDANQKLKELFEFIPSGKHKPRYGNLLNFLKELISAIPVKFVPNTREVWNFDYTSAIMD